jgi:hypothetical protein
LIYVDKLCGLVRSMMTTPKSDERSVSETVWASSAASQLVITRSRVVALLQKSALQDAGHYRLLLNIIDKVNK